MLFVSKRLSRLKLQKLIKAQILGVLWNFLVLNSVFLGSLSQDHLFVIKSALKGLGGCKEWLAGTWCCLAYSGIFWT